MRAEELLLKVGSLLADGPLLPPTVRFRTSPHLTMTVEDWSEVRSPGRARRRLRLGHPQRIIYRIEPRPEAYRLPDGTIVMHPAILEQLKAAKI